MYIVSIEEDQCTGCNACADSCPAHLLEFTGDKTIVSGDESACLGCESCVTVCPTGAITITEM